MRELPVVLLGRGVLGAQVAVYFVASLLLLSTSLGILEGYTSIAGGGRATLVDHGSRELASILRSIVRILLLGRTSPCRSTPLAPPVFNTLF